MLMFSGFTGASNVIGTGMTNAFNGDPLTQDMKQSFEIGFFSSLIEGSSIAAGFEGAVTTTGFSLITGALSLPGISADSNSTHNLATMLSSNQQPQQPQQPVVTTPPPSSTPYVIYNQDL
jgi:hypothetical protein